MWFVSVCRTRRGGSCSGEALGNYLAFQSNNKGKAQPIRLQRSISDVIIQHPKMNKWQWLSWWWACLVIAEVNGVELVVSRAEVLNKRNTISCGARGMRITMGIKERRQEASSLHSKHPG